jgi:glycosyltransferase involved in cell wall biosynthesis
MPYFFPLLSIFTKKKNIIYAAHDVVDHKNVKKRKLIQLYKRFIFKTFGHFHLFSRTQQELFLSLYPEKNTFYAPLMLKDFGEPKLKNRDDKINFLFFGIIRENKGLNLLIEAGNKLAKHYSDKFKITIAGKCYNWDYYSNVIEHPENFELTIRTIQNLEIPDLFNSADYLILPYLDVTQSGPLLIAYNYNLPVIASNHKGFSEYIKHGDNGYLFETENGHELYGIMKGIIRAKNFQINQIKKNLSEFVEKNISLNLISKNYIDFFNSL